MAASMCSSSTAVDEPFNGGGELMEALEPFTIKAASLLPPPPPSSLPSLFEQPGYIGLNQLTPTQIKIKQIQAQINQQLLPPHHDMSSAAKGNQCCILKKILELVLASARVNPFAEHILFHMEAIGDDLPLHPLNILRRRRDPLLIGAGGSGARGSAIRGGRAMTFTIDAPKMQNLIGEEEFMAIPQSPCFYAVTSWSSMIPHSRVNTPLVELVKSPTLIETEIGWDATALHNAA
nr:ethylene-responsive transcription factor ERF060-like [Ipomoea batatas]